MTTYAKHNYPLNSFMCGLLLALLCISSANASESIISGHLLYHIEKMGDGSHEATVSRLETYTANLVIPSTVLYNGENCKVTQIADRAFFYDRFETVKLGAYLRFLGTDAFYSSEVEDLVIPASVTTIHSCGIPLCHNLTIEGNADDNSSLTFAWSLWGSDDYHLGSVRKLYLDRNISGDIKFSSIKDVTFGPHVTYLMDRLFMNCSGITNLVLPINLKSIGHETFSETSITSLEIPPNVETIGCRAFANSKIEFLKVDGIEGSPKLFMDFDVFADCNISNIVIHRSVGGVNLSFPTAKHIEIGGYATSFPSFSGCQELIDVKITAPVLNLNGNGFYGCSSLQSIILPESLEEIGPSCFNGCTSLVDISIPNNVSKIDDKAFFDCVALKEVHIGENVKELSSYAFYNCKQLETVTFKPGIERIEDNTFCNCASLKKIELPEGFVRLGSSAFSNCTSLSNISFPTSFKTFYGSQQFYGCTSLSKITCYGEIPAELSYGVKDMPFDDSTYQSAILSVPESAIQSYMASTPWKNFINLSDVDAIKIENNSLNILNGKLLSKDGKNLSVTIVTIDGKHVYAGPIYDAPNLAQGIYLIAINGSSHYSKYFVR